MNPKKRTPEPGENEEVSILNAPPATIALLDRKHAEDIVRQATRHVPRNLKTKIRVELLILVALSIVFFGLSARFDWFAAVTGWLVAHAEPKLDEIIFTMVFGMAGLAVFAVRRWRESESELKTRHQSQALMELLHDELERRVAELGIANQALSTEITDRTRAEAALVESESRYHSLFENMLEGYAYCATLFEQDQLHDFIYLEVNSAFEKLTGLKDIVGKKVSEVIPGIRESNRELFDIYTRVVLTGKPEKLETYVQGLGLWLSITVYSPERTHFVAVFDNITVRKRAEAQRERLADMVEASPDFIGYADPKTTLVQYINRHGRRMCGIGEDEDLENFKLSGVHPAWMNKKLAEVILPVAMRDGVWEGEGAFLHRSGREIPVSMAVIARKADNGEVDIIFTVSRDITERKLAEEALRASEMEFRALAEAMPQMVWMTRPDGWNIYCSQQWMDYTGLTLEESIGLGWNKVFHPDDQHRAWDAWQHALAMTVAYSNECRLRRADGIYRWWLIRGVPQLDDAGNILKWFGTCTDIHDMKLAELEISSTNQALRESNEKFNQLADNITDAFWIRSADMSEVQYVSPAFERIWGRSREGLYSNPQQWADFILPEDRERALAAFTGLTQDLPSLDIEYRIMRPDGEIRWIRVRGFQVRNTAGKLVRHTGIVTDVTERKRAEMRVEALHKELHDASRRAGMAEVATGVLHNVGNVLNSVNVSTSLVVERLQKSSVSQLTEVVKLMSDHAADLTEFLTLDERGRRVPQFLAQLALHLNRETREITAEMQTVAENVDHIKEIVNAQQSYAGTFGVLEPLDLRESINDALRIHAGAMSRHNIEIVRNFEPIAAVIVDKHKILQILVNLISNAKHAMIDSPVKTLTIKTYPSSDGGTQLSIADTGCGIPSENITRMFAHGFTTKKDGHGFGLHSSALAAKEMNALLIAHSDGVGHGAVFTLVFPPAIPGRMGA